MKDLESLVRARAQELESQFEPMFRGPRGYMLRKAFPKTIVYKTDTEAVTMRLDLAGHFIVERGEVPKPKIKLESTYEMISESFRTGDPARLPPGPMKMTMRFWWGSRTFDPRLERRKTGPF